MSDVMSQVEYQVIDASFGGVCIPIAIHKERELLSDILRSQGWYSERDLEIWKAFLSPGDFFVDVGANVGWYSLYAATLVGPHGVVLAVEPDASHAQLLRESVRRSSLNHVTIAEVAVGKKKEDGLLYRSRINFGDHFVVGGTTPKIADRESVAVKIERLDDLLKTISRRPRFLKIDVQGMEADVLLGMEELLGLRPRPSFVLEFAPGLMLRSGSSPFEIFAFIERERYMPYKLSGDHSNDPLIRPLSVQELFACTAEFRETELGWDLLLVHRDNQKDLELCRILQRQ